LEGDRTKSETREKGFPWKRENPSRTAIVEEGKEFWAIAITENSRRRRKKKGELPKFRGRGQREKEVIT